MCIKINVNKCPILQVLNMDYVITASTGEKVEFDMQC